MLQRVLITAGGTGGHVYPALAVAEALRECAPQAALFFVGSVGGFERDLVAKSGISFTAYDEVRAGPLHGVSPLRALQSVGKLITGTIQAVGLLRRHRPQAILTTGGWASFPIALAAWVMRVPLVIYLPDVEPGLTIKALRPFARRICVTTPDSAPYFDADKMVVTGYPLRQSVMQATREQAISTFQLDSNRKTLLVFGGSLGARSINIALDEALPQLLDAQAQTPLQIIHVTGNTDWERAQNFAATLPDATHYHVYPYLHETMGQAFAAADVVLCRSGASTLGELPYFGLASVLVPYPHAWRYQKVNADYLAARGAALVMEDANMGQALLPTLQGLLNDSGRLAAMQANAMQLAQPDAAHNIAQTIIAEGETKQS